MAYKCVRNLRALMFNLSSYPRRFYSSKNSSDKVVISDDGSVFVCWHPKPDFPYELTKPIEKCEISSNSILKSSWGPELKQIFKEKHADVARKELMDLTFTTKHRWFRRSRDRRAKSTSMDREYL